MTFSLPNLRRLALPVLLAAASTVSAQMLARPGWAGSGMNADPWWKHAIVYQLDPHHFTADGLRGIPSHLDYLHSLGVDAILLTDLTAPTPGAATPTQPNQSIDPALGTSDDLDNLIHQASSRGMRVLLDLDPHAANLTSIARLWLTQGIAGFYLPGGTTDQLTDLKKITNSFIGQRILLGDITSAQNRTADTPQLLADPRPLTVPQLTASAVRPALEASQETFSNSVPMLLSDGPTYPRSFNRYADTKDASDTRHDIDIAKTLAAILLTTRPASLLYYGQELGLAAPKDASSEIQWEAPPKPKPSLHPAPPPIFDPTHPNAAVEDASSTSLLNWYRQLAALHHSNRTISSGTLITLNHDDQNILAWVRKPQAITPISPPIVIICNLSAQPVQLSLKADMQRLHLRGSFLRNILRSDDVMGPMHLDGMTIAPYTVFIGELRY